MDNKRWVKAGVSVFGIVTFIIGLIWNRLFYPSIVGSPACIMTICSVGVLFLKNWARKGLIISMSIMMFILMFILMFCLCEFSYVKESRGVNILLIFILIFIHFVYFGIAIFYFTRPKVKQLFIKEDVVEQKNESNEGEGKDKDV